MKGTMDFKPLKMMGIESAAKKAKKIPKTKSELILPAITETYKADPAFQGKYDYSKSKAENLKEKMKSLKTKKLNVLDGFKKTK